MGIAPEHPVPVALSAVTVVTLDYWLGGNNQILLPLEERGERTLTLPLHLH